LTTKKGIQGNIRFTLVGGEPLTVDISSASHVILFERHFDMSAEIFQLAPRLEYIAFLAWSAATAAGLAVPAEFDDFVAVIDDIELIEKGKPANANPTAGGQSAEL